MLKKVLFGIAALVAIFLIIVATRPGKFRIERSIHIDAPAPVVFAQVNDFHRWDAWSPWAKLDPSMTKKIEGPPQGVGATYSWTGNDQVGAGRMTILSSQPPDKVDIELEFLRPWQATNKAIFLLLPEDDGTKVIWAMEGTNNFMAKAAGLFVDIDALIGKDFEKGLADMKKVSEKQQPSHANSGSGATIPTIG